METENQLFLGMVFPTKNVPIINYFWESKKIYACHSKMGSRV